FEPGDGRPVAARDAACVRLQVGFVVYLETHAPLTEFIDSLVYALYWKIQDCESRRLMIWFRIHQAFRTSGQCHNHRAFLSAGNFKPERLSIKFLRFLNIVHRKTAECFAEVKHG